MSVRVGCGDDHVGGGVVMERGPLALFGAIIAVGLGPALWLGAQFGRLPAPPNMPATVVVEDTGRTVPGGAGAGADQHTTRDTDVRRPVTGTRSAQPVRTVPRTTPSPSHTTRPTSASPSPIATAPPDVVQSPSSDAVSAEPSASPSASASVPEFEPTSPFEPASPGVFVQVRGPR